MMIPFLLFILTIIVFGGSFYLYLHKEQKKILAPKDKYDEKWDKLYKNTQSLSASATNRKDFWKGIGIGFALYATGHFGVAVATGFIVDENFVIIFYIRRFLPLLINIGTTIYFEVTTRRQIALGILTTTLGIYLVIPVILALLFLALCFSGGCSGLN